MSTATLEPPKRWDELMDCSVKLKPIRSKTQHKRAVGQVRALIRSNDRTKDQNDYLDTLVMLIKKYEDKTLPPVPHDPIGNIKFLMEEHDMNASDLGRLLGDRSMGSLILNGKRDLSKTNIMKLAKHFGTTPNAFMPAV